MRSSSCPGAIQLRLCSASHWMLQQHACLSEHNEANPGAWMQLTWHSMHEHEVAASAHTAVAPVLLVHLVDSLSGTPPLCCLCSQALLRRGTSSIRVDAKPTCVDSAGTWANGSLRALADQHTRCKASSRRWICSSFASARCLASRRRWASALASAAAAARFAAAVCFCCRSAAC